VLDARAKGAQGLLTVGRIWYSNEGARAPPVEVRNMCRNIKKLYNIDTPASEEEIRAAALQFVRKISGFTNPSHVNKQAFDRAVNEVAQVSSTLLRSLVH